MTVGDEVRQPEVARTRTRRGGRRLDPARDEAIAAAVLEVLGREGWSGLTMDAVAMAAGVGKATIYRRWSSKADLLLGVMDVAGGDGVTAPDTGDLRGDLVALLTAAVARLSGPAGRTTRSLLGAVIDDPALAGAYQRGPLACWDLAWATVFDRAVDRGEITREAAGSLAVEVGPAVLALRWLVTGRAVDADLVTEVVDDLVLPLLRCPRRRPEGT
ncbi:TetR/AcrR family transcriptional regulator [Geodermatophilus sp. SYSU D00697]